MKIEACLIRFLVDLAATVLLCCGSDRSRSSEGMAKNDAWGGGIGKEASFGIDAV